MTKIYVWPDATYLDADEYSEHEYGYKGDDYLIIDLTAITNGTHLIAGPTYLQPLKGNYVPPERVHELLRAELQLNATRSMFRNYRDSIREHLAQLHDEQAQALAKLSAEQTVILANKEQEIKTILTARDQWVKELQGKLSEATRMLNQSEEVNEELENNLRTRDIGMMQMADANSELSESNRKLRAELAVAKARDAKHLERCKEECAVKVDNLEIRPVPLPEDLAQENRRLKGVTAGAMARLQKPAIVALENQLKQAKAEIAKLKENAALYGEIERDIRQERHRLGNLLDKHGVCTECGEMFKRHRDELLASCGCQTVEWTHDFTPYMSAQRALAESRDAEHSQAERADDAEQRAQDLRNELQAMKHEVAGVISRLQEIE